MVAQLNDPRQARALEPHRLRCSPLCIKDSLIEDGGGENLTTPDPFDVS